MANAEGEGLDGMSSTDGRASCKSGHYRWSQGVVRSFLFRNERVDKIEVSQVANKHAVSVARQTHASRVNRVWSKLVGIVIIM